MGLEALLWMNDRLPQGPWLQQYLGIGLSASMGMIGVLEITLIVPALWTAPRKLDSLMIVPTRSDGHDQCRGRLVYNDERGATGSTGMKCRRSRRVMVGFIGSMIRRVQML